MSTFIASLGIFALAITGMAIGVILSKRCLKRECEHRQIIMQNSSSGTCDNCGKKI